jgi:hypothetical protein
LKIKLEPKHPRLEAINVTRARSREFADLLRELQEKDDSEKIEGHFTIYRASPISSVIELVFDEP